jgi:CRP-like cAMP-binding protein
MKSKDTLRLLKSIRLFDQIPERQLEALQKHLTPVEFKDGALVFEEGAPGDSMFFVTSGRVRISKRAQAGENKDLAILGPGECFGEMALVDNVARSASAHANGPTSLMRLHRDDLNRWLKSHPELAVDVFAQLVQVFTRRLRRTSNELTLLFDLSHVMIEAPASGQELLTRVLDHILPHLEGDWSAAACLYNPFNDEMEQVAAQGPTEARALKTQLPPRDEKRSLWLDDRWFYVSLPGRRQPHGYLLFHTENPMKTEERDEAARTLSAVGRLLASALENLDFRLDESLRERLKQRVIHGADL